MPVNNKSTNKIRVTKLFQADAIVGLIDPAVGMMTNYGKILSVNADNSIVTVGVGQHALAGSGTVPKQFYAHDLLVLYSVASGTHGFPSASGCVQFGHGQTFPNGVPVVSSNQMVNMPGTLTPNTFTRP